MVHRRDAAAFAAAIAVAGGALAQNGIGTVRLDNWGIVQSGPSGTSQWQYRPRVYVPFDLGNAWVFTLRADMPMNYTNASGPANPGGGYSGGIGNALIETILDTPQVAPNLTLRASLRLVFPSPKGQPFGNDSQYQVAPGLGFTYKMADTLNGVTVSPYVRYFRGFNAQSAATALVSNFNLFPAATFGLVERWSLALYPENPITYNRSSGSWFVPFDFMFLNRVSKEFEFGIGGAFKLGNPSNPSYDYIVNGRVTYYF